LEVKSQKKNLIIRYFASRQKRQEYNWQQIDIWAFRSSLPTGRQACLRQAGVFPAYGRQASSVPISKENKATGVIADLHKKKYYYLLLKHKND
jgi:hypothetical protein